MPRIWGPIALPLTIPPETSPATTKTQANPVRYSAEARAYMVSASMLFRAQVLE